MFRKFGQNIETLKLAKVGLAKVGHDLGGGVWRWGVRRICVLRKGGNGNGGSVGGGSWGGEFKPNSMDQTNPLLVQRGVNQSTFGLKGV